MKRTLLYVAMLTVALVIPVERTNLEEMKPVEVVYLYEEADRITLSTDTGDRGSGIDIPEAMSNLRQTTAGIIYLDTANYLLIGKETEVYVKELRPFLKDDVRICIAEGKIDMETVGQYLRVHQPEVKMEDWATGSKLKTLKGNGGLKLVE